MRDKRPEITNNELMILQCNLNRNQSIMNSILNDPHAKKFTILALQEHRSRHTKSPLTHHSWTLIEPTTTTHQPRSAIYINNTTITSTNFEPLHFPFSDVT